MVSRTRTPLETVRYGKPVVSAAGPLAEGAEYAINASSDGVPDPIELIPAGLFDEAPPTPGSIEPAFASRGALVVKAAPAGLVACRIRFRPEAGEDRTGRAYLLSHTVLATGATRWRNVPAGFFSWCEASLDAPAFVEGGSQIPEPVMAEMTPPPFPDAAWLDSLDFWRQLQLAGAYDALLNGRSWLADHPPAFAREPRPGAILAGDMDILAMLISERGLGAEHGQGFLFAMGLDPAYAPGAISYLANRRGEANPERGFDALRRAIHQRPEQPATAARADFLDNMGRRIGRDPIRLGLNMRQEA